MNPKWRLWLAGILFVLVVAAALYFPALRRQVNKAKTITEKSAEEARRELMPATPAATGEPRVKAKMFWGSTDSDGKLVAVTVELPLSSDPALRAKEILNTLLAGPVDQEARTLPPDAALLAFYILPDGTAVADFSEALATSIPSGIQSEQLAVDSIARTLEANVPQVRRLKILIHGQEVETLAGHLDLTQTFDVSTAAANAPAPARSGVAVITAPIEHAIEKVKGATKRP
jgi:spore germination protein GerM